ncbi:MAG TPA: ATP phosphoribosyltransferase [Spirochaetota bacterium]|nr:ATP phosphoribosyltransferase [Spirochaetota bacterium]HOL56222.1 ATP phosphoribosyltransferase [Spirochaetota bacterium]HPP03805.1 ATP phosphoribosyltransferase [Spirochaetota bacterium]
MEYLTIALPKGRLIEKISDFFLKKGIINSSINEDTRRLDFIDEKSKIRFLFVKNSDVPVYVHYGVAQLGVCGSDIVYESDFEFLNLTTFPFGKTRICLAGFEKDKNLYFNILNSEHFIQELKIATKFVKWTKNFFINKNIPVNIIKLSGSIELAPILGLSHFIVDLVETGTTLKENNLSIIEEIGETEVKLIANPSLYKLNYKEIDTIVSMLNKEVI